MEFIVFTNIIMHTFEGGDYDASSLCDTPKTENKFLALSAQLGFGEGNARSKQILVNLLHTKTKLWMMQTITECLNLPNNGEE